MSLHDLAFEFLSPSTDQIGRMSVLRQAFQTLNDIIEEQVPDGPDRTHTQRILRTAAMWANVAVTRHADGTPRDRSEEPDYPPDHPAPGDLGSVPL
jgi:hypothetical protein